MKTQALILPVTPNRKKKLYRKPDLIRLGDLRSLTLGGTPGGGESNNTKIPRNPMHH